MCNCDVLCVLLLCLEGLLSRVDTYIVGLREIVPIHNSPWRHKLCLLFFCTRREINIFLNISPPESETKKSVFPKCPKVVYLAAFLCSYIYPTVFDLTSSVSPSVVFHHRETGTEASYDRGFYHNGHLQYRNHINSHHTGVCVCVCAGCRNLVKSFQRTRL